MGSLTSEGCSSSLLAWLALGRRALLDLIPQTSQLTKPQRRQKQERELPREAIGKWRTWRRIGLCALAAP